MYCNTLVCIAEKRVETVSQYSSLYSDSRASGLLDCVPTQGRNTASQATTLIKPGLCAVGALGARLGMRGALEGARHEGVGRGTGARRATGQQVVHSVHSAYF